jgi:hypothetical protein
MPFCQNDILTDPCILVSSTIVQEVL